MLLINYGKGELELFDEAPQPGNGANTASISEPDMGSQERAAKRIRIEQHARDYLLFRPVFIQSAFLKGPFTSDWVNPWNCPKKSTLPGGQSMPKSSAREAVDTFQLLSVAETPKRDARKRQRPKAPERPKLGSASLREREIDLDWLWPEHESKTLASSSAPTTQNNIASLKKSVKCPPRNTTKLPPKDQIADSKPRKTPDFPVEGSMRLDDKVVTPPRETSECPHGDDPSRGLLVIDEKSPHAQSREDTNVELQRIETDTVTGFTPVNARTSSYAYDGMSHQRRASRGIESVTRHEEESAIVDTVPQSHSDKENHTTGLNLLEAVEGCSTHQDAANSANATNRISQKVMREAALKCTRPATACSTKRRPISSKGQQRRRRASNPKQPISVAMLKPTEPPSPFVFQRRAGYHVDENPDQALPSTTYLPDERPSEPPQVSFGEDWAVVEHYTNCILPRTQPNTTPSKKVSNRIRKILRTSGASMQSTMDTIGNEAAKDNGKATTVETTSLANPNHTGSNTLNEASFPTDISTQAAMHLAHCALQDTLISPTKPVMTPAPANRATAQADSQRRITLSGPPINTQDILADVSSFAFDTAQKLVDNGELFGNVVQLQSPMSPTRTPQKEGINGPASQQDNNPGTREDGDAMGLLGESFNLSETIEDMSVYLKDSNAGVEEMRAVTMDKEIAQVVMEK